MLTKVERQTVEFFVQLATWVPTIPLDWDATSNKLKPTTSKLKYYTVLGNLVQSVAYFIFIITRFIPGFPYDYKNGERKRMVVEFTFHFLFLLKQSILMFIQYFLFTRSGPYCEWYCVLEEFNKSYGLAKLKKTKADPHWKDPYLRSFKMLICIVVALALFIFPTMSENPNFLYSAFPKEWRPWWVFYLLVAIEMYILLSTASVFLLTVVFTYAQIYPILFWQNQARKWLAKGYTTLARQTLNIVRLLMSMWETQQIYDVLKVHCQLAIVALIFISIRLSSFLSLVIVFVPPGAAICVVLIEGSMTSAMTNVYETSVNMKRELRAAAVGMRSDEQKLYLRMVQGYRPARCKNALFHYKKSAKLLSLGLLLNMSNYALVSF